MSDPIVIVGPDGHGYVSIAEHERVRRKSAFKNAALRKIAAAMNQLADELDAENANLETETRPAPLGD